jgi:hypothetical protein
MAQARDGTVPQPAVDLEIPLTSPAAVAAPAMPGWIAAAHAARAALDAAKIQVGGMPLGALRRAARAEVTAIAAEYTRGLGVSVPPVATALVLATGHQPLLVHPGIWIKYLALGRLVPPQGIGLNVIVDSDAADEVAAEIPQDRDGLRRARLVLARGGPNVPFESIAAPGPDDWRAFAAEVDRYIASVDEPDVGAGWARARQALPPPFTSTIADAVTAARRALEGPRPYLDIPVSRLAGTEAFRGFAVAILREAGRFAVTHNASLDAYREQYGIRTAAQPFPNLMVEGARIEVPFWYLHDGRRWPLYVDPLGLRLVAAERDLGPVPDDPAEASFTRLQIRPRALTLTAFVRLVVSDFFIHGVGGGRYDRATDAVIRAFFDLTPPAYGTVTATLFLPFAGGSSPDAERHRLLRRLLDLQHNPDRFLTPDGGANAALIEEKWALIRTLERPQELTRRARRAATQRIRELNEILQVGVAGQVAEVQAALDRLARDEADSEVTRYRGYPFLLHRLEDVETLVDLLVSSPTDSPP